MMLTHKRFPKVLPFIFLVALAFSACSSGESTVKDDPKGKTSIENYKRIVSLNGAITEMLFALNVGDKVVGLDVTSTYPPEANKLPKLGHITQLNAEGVLSLKPDLILAYEDFSDQGIIDQLKKAGVTIKKFPKPYSFDASQQLIIDIAKLSGAQEAGKKLLDQYQADLEELEVFKAAFNHKHSGMFLYARGAGNLLVAGGETQMNEMIKLAGGENVYEDAFTGFKPLTPESLAKTNPEFIVLFSNGIKSIEGEKGLLQVPGMELTDAGKYRHFIVMDGHYVSSFGPRAAKAALELGQKIHTNPNQAGHEHDHDEHEHEHDEDENL